MRAQEIIALQKSWPFRGLRIHLSDGKSYAVPHPEMMTVTRTLVFIALGGGTGGIPRRWIHCDPVHITRIGPLEDEAGV